VTCSVTSYSAFFSVLVQATGVVRVSAPPLMRQLAAHRKFLCLLEQKRAFVWRFT